MTLVSAYERLIGARGVELGDPALLSSKAETTTTGAVTEAMRTEADEKKAKSKSKWKSKRKKKAKRSRYRDFDRGSYNSRRYRDWDD
jgi:hypothetical protein